MGNMSYCRFENTARDLSDCVDAIQRGDIHELSEYEIQSAEWLLQLAEELIDLKYELEAGIEASKKELNYFNVDDD